jgi:hypothetical protein
LVPTSFLIRFQADVLNMGVLEGKNLDLGPNVGHSGEVLVDLKDHSLVNDGLFLDQVEDRLLACRAIKADSVWILYFGRRRNSPPSR